MKVGECREPVEYSFIMLEILINSFKLVHTYECINDENESLLKNVYK